ncbi:dienelactone hydrolase family protein [Hoeflea sp.]|uniref:dienelactone hydrolase family protein n=1 Tax=Hoeflea sp. TaxID=1940281 RepID=UPI003B51A017
MPYDFRRLIGSARRQAAIIVAMAIILFQAVPAMSAPAEIEVDGLLLPADTKVEAGSASPFAGAWVGRWDGVLKTILVVESIDAEGVASVIYSVAANPQRGFDRAWFRLAGRVEGSRMLVEGRGFSLALKFSKTGRLRAVFGDGYSFAILAKRDLKEMIQPGAEIDWSPGTSLGLATCLTEDNEPVELETVLYKPAGPGPHPLAIVNHGSTGLGNDPELFGQTWSHDWLADVLNERGYLVAFPQRRGRGRSGGLYAEGLEADRTKGYSCDPERALAGADRAIEDLDAAIAALRRRDDITAGPVLMAGVSRGGMLAAVHAGHHPAEVSGVINFVGGWIGELCETSETINQNLVRRASAFQRPMLWLYGEDDPYYSIDHTRAMHAEFTEAGGSADYHAIEVRGSGNGHWVAAIPPLWMDLVEAYLDSLSD